MPEVDRMQFSINDADAQELAKQALIIEKHYGRPMDIEWAKDGDDQQLYIVQARPETVKSQETGNAVDRYKLNETGDVLCEGRSIGQRIGKGSVRIVDGIANMDQVQEGDILVTDMTDPDWEPVMKRASAIVTNRGGRTCHAAIIARELGIPAVVGCGDATENCMGTLVTVSCAEGDTGYVYAGDLDFTFSQDKVDAMPSFPLKLWRTSVIPIVLCLSQACRIKVLAWLAWNLLLTAWWRWFAPKALLGFEQLQGDLKAAVARRLAGVVPRRHEYFRRKSCRRCINHLRAASFAPEPVLVRMSDFKSE